MTAVPDRATFENFYAGQTPWEIGRPEKVFLDVADRITGSSSTPAAAPGETPCNSPSEAAKSQSSTSAQKRSGMKSFAPGTR